MMRAMANSTVAQTFYAENSMLSTTGGIESRLKKLNPILATKLIVPKTLTRPNEIEVHWL